MREDGSHKVQATKSKDDDIEETAYQCPGESDRISFAVHQARLEAGWLGCSGCIWNDQQPSSAEANLAAAMHRPSIRRTPFGIRGSYLNAVDRTKASLLASIFVSHLAELEFDNQKSKLDAAVKRSAEQGGNEEKQNAIALTAASLIIVGYDTDPNAPDLFAGVVQAVRQAGANVIDIGCCTAASLQHSIRRLKAIGGIIVTSARCRSGEIGLDIFDRQGQTVSVPWQKYGIRVRLQKTARDGSDSIAGSKPEQFAQDLRRQLEADATVSPVSEFEAEGQLGELILPNTSEAPSVPSGRRRHSGKLQTQSTEADYRNSVLKWWGVPKLRSTLRVFCQNEIVANRIEWLAAASSVVVEVHEGNAPKELIRTAGTRQQVTIEIDQDDRLFTVWSKTGRQISVSELTDWLNQKLSRTLRHVTAHAADSGQMIRLLDLAGPDSAESHETTTDAVAIAGLLLHLNEDGRHALPA